MAVVDALTNRQGIPACLRARIWRLWPDPSTGAPSAGDPKEESAVSLPKIALPAVTQPLFSSHGRI